MVVGLARSYAAYLALSARTNDGTRVDCIGALDCGNAGGGPVIGDWGGLRDVSEDNRIDSAGEEDSGLFPIGEDCSDHTPAERPPPAAGLLGGRGK